jgi:outer membrane protein TolC
MARTTLILLLSYACASMAETVTLTLREAVDLALKQNSEIVLARFDEQRAEQAVRLAKAPFVPTVLVGSGLAYSSGFPMSIEGATPSILQAQAVSHVFNRSQSYRVAAAQELRRAASLDSAGRRDEVAYRTADLYLQARTAAQGAEVVRQEIGGLERVLETVRLRVSEGRELPVEGKRAELGVARARYRLQVLESNRQDAESALSAVLGLPPEDRVETVETAWPEPPLPDSPEAAVKAALENNRELRVLESHLIAKGLDVRAERAARLPQVDLVAQYGLLARFNNYEDFFRKFQRHNGQLGVSFQVPVFTSPAVNAGAQRAEAEAAQIRTRMRNLRSSLAADARRAFGDLDEARAAVEVARLDLEVARDQVSVLLAQMQEGRAALRQVQDGRTIETEKWIAWYEAGAALERARLALLRITGSLTAALQ